MRRKQSERNSAKTRLRQPSLGALSGTFSSIKTSKMAVRMAETSLLGDPMPLLLVEPSLKTLMHSTSAAAAYPLAQPWP